MALQSESGGMRSGTVRALEHNSLEGSQSCIVKSLAPFVLKVGGSSVCKGTPVATVGGCAF